VNAAQRKIIHLVIDLIFYEINHAGDGMLISEEADRLVERHPVGGRAFILCVGAVVFGHLANVVDERIDLLAKRFWRKMGVSRVSQDTRL